MTNREAANLLHHLSMRYAGGLTKLLVEAGTLKAGAVESTFAAEYEYMANVKAKFLNVGVEKHGLVFRTGQEPYERRSEN